MSATVDIEYVVRYPTHTMRQLCAIIVLIVCLGSTSPVYGESLIPTKEWTKETHIWLARSWIAEAGFAITKTKKLEQHAIGYVLERRWRQISKNYKKFRFLDVIRMYCSGLKKNGKFSQRQLWVRHLLGQDSPKYWPRKLNWKHYQPLWADTLVRTKKFMKGELRNPCPGASYFGGLTAGDVPGEKMIRHRCSDLFENQKTRKGKKVPGTTFYIIDNKL